MFYSNSNSNFYWTELLFRLTIVPFLALLLLLLSSQLIRLQPMPTTTPPIALQYPSDLHKNIDF
jgi:hypothetical protein